MREQSDVGLIYRLADEGIVGIQDEEGYFTEKNTMEEVQLKTLKNRSWADVKRAYVELEPNKKSGTAYYEVEIPKYEDGNKPRVTVITGDKNNYLPLLGDIIASKEVEDGTLQVYSTPLESDEEIKGVKVVVGLATGGDHASYIVIEQDEFHIKEPEPENKEIELEVTGESEYYNTDINGDRKNLLKEEVEYGKRDGKLYGEEIELKQSYKYTESEVNKGDTIKFTVSPISDYHEIDRIEKSMSPEVELKGKQELDNGEVEYTYEVISEDMDVGEQSVFIQAYFKPKSYEDYHKFYEDGFKVKDGQTLKYHIVPRTFTLDDFKLVNKDINKTGEMELPGGVEILNIDMDIRDVNGKPKDKGYINSTGQQVRPGQYNAEIQVNTDSGKDIDNATVRLNTIVNSSGDPSQYLTYVNTYIHLEYNDNSNVELYKEDKIDISEVEAIYESHLHVRDYVQYYTLFIMGIVAEIYEIPEENLFKILYESIPKESYRYPIRIYMKDNKVENQGNGDVNIEINYEIKTIPPIDDVVEFNENIEELSLLELYDVDKTANIVYKTTNDKNGELKIKIGNLGEMSLENEIVNLIYRKKQ